MVDEATKAFLGIGGNVGDVLATIRRAILGLHDHDQIEVTAVSPVYRTPPWGKEDQDWFHNACIELSTMLTPRQLLDVCLSIETGLDRKRDERWGPRTIDLDILLFGDAFIDEPGLQVPHPRMAERAFVLKPLADLDENLTVAGESVSELLTETGSSKMEMLDLPPNWWREPA